MSVRIINMGDVSHMSPQQQVAYYRGKGVRASLMVRHNQSRPDDITVVIGGPPMPVFHSVRSHNGFSIGDRVRLNRRGLAVIRGLDTPEQIDAQTRGVLILELYPHNDPADICGVELEEPFDNLFLDLKDLEKVPHASSH